MAEKQSNCLIPISDEEVIKKFFIAKDLEGLSKTTLKTYYITLKKLSKNKNKPFCQVNIDDLREYFTQQKLNGLRNNTLNKDLRALKVFYAFMRDEGYILIAPTARIRPAKLPKRVKDVFTAEEIIKIRKGANCLRDKAIVDTLLSTGVRVSELVNIKIKDIQDKKINVIGKGNKERVVFLNTRAKSSIEEYLSSRTTESEYLFINHSTGNNLKQNTVQWILRQIGERQDIMKCVPHKFRRTMGTIAVKNGISINNVRQMLGHESFNTTIIYVQTDVEELENLHQEHMENY